MTRFSAFLFCFTVFFSAQSQTYCTPSFSGDCSTDGDHQYVWRVNIIEPAGDIFNAIFSGVKLGHCPSTSSCNTPDSDYQFHQYGGTNDVCAGFADSLGIGSDGYPIDTAEQYISSASFDFFVYGNDINNPGFPNAMALSVFIDWNGDGDFEDENEIVISTPLKPWAAPNPKFYPLEDQNVYLIVVPANSITGIVRMRVIASPIAYNEDACLNNSSGSARDYEIKINNMWSDLDQDGVHDELDLCPNWDDALLGAACQDGFDNTIDDIYTDCQLCQGVDMGCPSDINNDGTVDINDFLSFVSAFGDPCTSCTEDLTGDGQVNVTDFILLNSQFGWICGP